MDHLSYVKIIRRLFYYHGVSVDKILKKYPTLNISYIHNILADVPKVRTHKDVERIDEIHLGSKREPYYNNELEYGYESKRGYRYEDVKGEKFNRESGN